MTYRYIIRHWIQEERVRERDEWTIEIFGGKFKMFQWSRKKQFTNWI